MKPAMAAACLGLFCLRLCSAVAVPTAFRSSLRASSGLSKGFSAAAPEMPEECSAMCSSGADSCEAMYSTCSCCEAELQLKLKKICSQYKGSGDCIDNIRAAIDEKEKKCDEKVARQKKEHDARMEELDRLTKAKEALAKESAQFAAMEA